MDACHQCGKVFSKKCHLLRHLRETHSAPKFNCDYCGKFYRRMEYIKKHNCKGATTAPDQLLEAITATITKLHGNTPAVSSSTETIRAATPTSAASTSQQNGRHFTTLGAPFPCFRNWDSNISPSQVEAETWTIIQSSRSDIWNNRDRSLDQCFRIGNQPSGAQEMERDPTLACQLSFTDLTNSSLISGLINHSI
ncbi:hypothetical protein SNE40_021207 [Patella caerulea]|uniref:C2H2-type domain-containing protein n=1 Tax=Patella caerulea TaxID=87958 RepID=A0AAN8J0H0_PATCE